MTAPFIDAAPSEVCARVAYQLIRLDWRKNPERYVYPAFGVSQLARSLSDSGSPILLTTLAAATNHLRLGRSPLSKWLQDVIYRSRWSVATARAGRPWAMPPVDPPVSNTGVRGHDAALGGKRRRQGRRGPDGDYNA